jgi:hypothetical protein
MGLSSSTNHTNKKGGIIMKNYDKYHLKVFEDLYENYDDIRASDIERAIWDGKCDGLLLEFKPDITNIFGSDSDRYLFLSKPESIEKVEEILQTKIVLLKDNEYRISFATSSVPITGFVCCGGNRVSQDKSLRRIKPFSNSEGVWDSAREKKKIAVFNGILRFLKGIDVINIPKSLDSPVMSYGKLNEGEYMIGALCDNSKYFYMGIEKNNGYDIPIMILVKNEREVRELWPKIKKEGLLTAIVKISGAAEEEHLSEELLYLAEDAEGYIEVIIDSIIRRRYMPNELLIDKLYEVIIRYGYTNIISKKELSKAIKGLIEK